MRCGAVMSLHLASVQSGGPELENRAVLVHSCVEGVRRNHCLSASLRGPADCVLSEQLASPAEKREEDEMLACRDAKEQLLVETLESSVRSSCSSGACANDAGSPDISRLIAECRLRKRCESRKGVANASGYISDVAGSKAHGQRVTATALSSRFPVSSLRC